MGKHTDENIRIFIDESLEHLSNIENELLAIEQRGADIDEALVNKVYRAAHSIKGGAGFMGLVNIKNLTHEMENVLGKIRAREIVPDASIINALLLASDALRNLINDIDDSDDADIAEHMASLNAITEGLHEPEPYAENELKPVTNCVNISFPGERCIFSVSDEDISNIRKQGKYLYLIEVDLIQFSEIKGETLLSVIDDMKRCGVIMDSRPDIPTAENPDADKSSPFMALFATVLKPDDVSQLLNYKTTNIYVVNEDHMVKPVTGAVEEISENETEDVPDKSLVSKPELGSERNSSEKNPMSVRATDVEEISGTETEDSVKESLVPKPELENEKKPELGNEKKNQTVIKSDSKHPIGDTEDQSGETDARPKTEQSVEPITFQTSLRVNIKLLDLLMTLAGELVLSRNQLLQAIIRNDRRALEISGQRIDLITSKLQEAIMHTRMQPVQNIFNKFPRVVRDLAIILNKKIDLNIEGKEVELDKSIIENLNDPMTHLIRNAADHGIELPEFRKRLGKNPVGTIRLKAYHEAGQVNIEISDDGKGIDGEIIARSAIAKGLVSEELVRGMSAGEKVNLIFLPGFSMSDKITELSGRGVGMDVVKTNLDSLGGLVDIDSKPGKGTIIHIKLPLTLAIIPSLLVSDGNEPYAIPQVNVVELLRIPPSRVRERIEHVGNAQVVRLRDKLLPLMRLSDVLRHETGKKSAWEREEASGLVFQTKRREQENAKNQQPTAKSEQPQSGGVNIVVVSTGIFKYGMIVDKLHDSEEIVVKPLGRHLKDCRGYAGATILGDGRVALILDVADLARLAELTSISGAIRESESAEKIMLPAEDHQTLLLFRNSEKTRFAVPLELVERIEKIRCKDIETAGGRRVIQYRNTSMPLFDVGDAAMVDKFEEKEYALVIVFFVAGMDVGILAIPPIDTVKTAYRIDETTLSQPGISGSAVIDGKTTLMVDVIGIIEAIHPEWFAVERSVKRQTEDSKTIILAEDSKFFRNQIKCTIEDAGYHVIEAEDGMIAWNLLQKNADDVSLVVTDLEMPNLDGFGFTRQIKDDERFSHLPVIAVSSLAGKEDIKRAKASGVDEYQVKLDRKKLIECIKHYMRKSA